MEFRLGLLASALLIVASAGQRPAAGQERSDPVAGRVRLSSIADVEGELPKDESGELFVHLGDSSSAGAERQRPWQLVQWESPGICYHPLYFEDEAVERNGQHRGILQPAVSAAHFFGRVPALPYLMAQNPFRSCEYPLGAIRPGSCVAPYRHQWKFSPIGGLSEAGVATGLIFLIP